MRKIIVPILAVLLIIGLTGCAEQKPEAGSKFPQKAVELVVPFAPGGVTDIAARILANSATKYLPNGQAVVVTNKPGGGGIVGTTEVFNAKPDGYKIAFASSAPLSIQPHYGKTSFTHDSFQPLMRALSFGQVLVVKNDSPWKTFEEWLDYVKKNPDSFTYGTTGTGGVAHLTMERLNHEAGLKSKHVPFAGAAPALTALLGGHIQGVIVAPNDVNNEEFRILVDFGSKKNAMLNSVPLLKEKGINITQNICTGLIAPKGLPKDVADVLHTAFKKALEDPATIAEFKKIGFAPAYSSPEAFQKEITDDFNTSKVVLKRLGLIQ